MARCSICQHPKRGEIDKALVAGESFRRVAAQFGGSATSLRRHKDSHLVDIIERAEKQHERKVEQQVAAQEQRKDNDALDVMVELKRIFNRLNKMLDACDAWLTDADNPDVYDLNPRVHELKVTYEEVNGPVVLRRKKPLSELLDIAKGDKTNITFTMVEHKSADPRKLIIETANALRPSVELLGKLVGDLPEVNINILLSPQWVGLRAQLVRILEPYPDAIEAVGLLNGITRG